MNILIELIVAFLFGLIWHLLKLPEPVFYIVLFVWIVMEIFNKDEASSINDNDKLL